MALAISMNDNVNIRTARAADYPALYEIFMDDAVNPYMIFEKMSYQEFVPRIEALAARDTIYVLASNGGEILSTVRINRLSARSAHVVEFSSFATHPASQRQGLGLRLLNLCADKVRRDFPDAKIAVLSAESDNPKVIDFYRRKLGFNSIYTFTKWLKRYTGQFKSKDYVDEIFMAHYLDSDILQKVINPDLPSVSATHTFTDCATHDPRLATLADVNNSLILCQQENIQQLTATDVEQLIGAGNSFIVEHDDTVVVFLHLSYGADRLRHTVTIEPLVLHPQLPAEIAGQLLKRLVVLQRQQGVLRADVLALMHQRPSIEAAGFAYKGVAKAFYKFPDRDAYADLFAYELPMFTE